MSTTSLIAFSKDKPGKIVNEFKNAWLSAPLLWNYLSKKYLNRETMPYSGSELAQFWNLWKDPKLEEWEAALLVLTYDHCVVKKEDFELIQKYIQKFDDIIQKPNHFKVIRDELTQLKNEDIIGVGFIWTSVADDIWSDPDSENGAIITLSKLKVNDDFFFLFDDDFKQNRSL